MTEAFKPLDDRMDAHIEAYKAAVDEVSRFMDVIDDIEAQLDGPLAVALLAHRRDMEELIALYQMGAMGADDFERAISVLARRLAAGLPQDAMRRSFADAALEGVAEGVRGAFDRLTGSDILSMSFNDFGRIIGFSIADSVGRSVGAKIGERVSESIGDSLGKHLGPALSEAFGAIGGSLVSAGIQRIFDKIFPTKDPKFQFGGSAAALRATGAGRIDTQFSTAMGEVFFRFRKIEVEAQNQLRNALVSFDQILAGIIRDDGRLEAARRALANVAFDSADEGANLQQLLEKRWSAVLSGMDAFTRSIVEQMQGLEAQMQRFAELEILRIMANLDMPAAGFGSLEDFLWTMHALGRAGESLTDTYRRLTTVVGELDTASALTGNAVADSRLAVYEFGAALSDVFGDDLQRLTRGMQRIFAAFFTDEERLSVASEQARQRASDLFERLGLDVADSVFTESGFRALFDQLFGQLSAEDLALLIEAGVAVADLIDAERELAEIRGELVGSAEDLAAQLAGLMQGIDRDLLRIVSPARARFQELADRMAAAMTQAIALGASEAELARIRELHHRSMQRMIGDLTVSILRLADQFFGVEDSFTDIGNAISRATSNVRDAVIRSLERIDDWLGRSLIGNFSPLSPTERLGEARSQFEDAFRAAMGGDFDALANLPALADALLGEGASFFGTSTADFRALFDMVRSMMQQASAITPPAEMQPPTFGQVEDIRGEVSIFRQRLDELEQMQAAWNLGDQIGTLASLTEQTPAELARSLGFTDRDMRRVLETLGHDIPWGTSMELADYFNDVVAEIGNQNPMLRAIRDSNDLQYDMFFALERGLWLIGDVLVQILEEIGGAYAPPEFGAGMSFATGGMVPRTGQAMVHSGEYVVPRNGALVRSDPEQTAILRRMDDRLRNLERINGSGFATVADEERRTRQTMARKTETARA